MRGFPKAIAKYNENYSSCISFIVFLAHREKREEKKKKTGNLFLIRCRVETTTVCLSKVCSLRMAMRGTVELALGSVLSAVLVSLPVLRGAKANTSYRATRCLLPGDVTHSRTEVYCLSAVMRSLSLL